MRGFTPLAALIRHKYRRRLLSFRYSGICCQVSDETPLAAFVRHNYRRRLLSFRHSGICCQVSDALQLMTLYIRDGVGLAPTVKMCITLTYLVRYTRKGTFIGNKRYLFG